LEALKKAQEAIDNQPAELKLAALNLDEKDKKALATYQSALDYAKANGGQYLDMDFLPQASSLIANMNGENDCDVEKWKTYQWKRVSEIEELKGNLKVFKGGIEPNDILQGSLGDCYFLSTLSVLAEKPKRIRDLFVKDEIRSEGCYAVKLCKNGEQQTIVIDDHVPVTEDGKIVFSRGHGLELWVVLIEKAWAKIHGSYERIIGGQAHLTMRDLTGAPAEEFKSKEKDMFKKILDADQKNYMMTAGTGGSNIEAQNLKLLGLIAGHAYGLIAAASVNDKDGNNVELVQLRNPWGGTEWNGDWSDKSDKWTPELKAQLKLTDSNDGTFWMDFKEMRQYFTRIQICKYVEGNKFSYKSATQLPDDYTLMKVEVPEDGDYTFSVSLRGKRMFPRGASYEYSHARMILMKPTNGQDIHGGVTYIKGHKSYNTRDSHLECTGLAAGTYYFFVEMEWSPKSGNFKLVTTSYGPKDVEFVSDDYGKYEKSDVLKQAFISKSALFPTGLKLSDMSGKGAPLCKKTICTEPDDGYMYFMIQNEETDNIYKEECEFPTFEGMSILPPFYGNQYTLEVPPKTTDMAIVRCSSAGYSYNMAFGNIIKKGQAGLRAECLESGEKKERAPGI